MSTCYVEDRITKEFNRYIGKNVKLRYETNIAEEILRHFHNDGEILLFRVDLQDNRQITITVPLNQGRIAIISSNLENEKIEGTETGPYR